MRPPPPGFHIADAVTACTPATKNIPDSAAFADIGGGGKWGLLGAVKLLSGVFMGADSDELGCLFKSAFADRQPLSAKVAVELRRLPFGVERKIFVRGRTVKYFFG